MVFSADVPLSPVPEISPKASVLVPFCEKLTKAKVFVEDALEG